MLISFVSSFLFLFLFYALAKGDVNKVSGISLGFGIPVAVTLLIVWVFYPGFMTFDTFHALDGAREGVKDSTWPPVVSYIWRMIDVFFHSPVAMFFSQLLLLVGSVFYVMYYFLKSSSFSLVFLLAYLIIPVVIGTAAAIWKDVLMASFFVAAFAMILAAKESGGRVSFFSLFGGAVVLVFLGICTRHNAITAAVPLMFYFAWVLTKRFPARVGGLAFIAVVGVVLSGVAYTAKLQLDKYSIPEFREIKGATKLIRITRVMDIAGASMCSGKNLFEAVAPALTLSDIQAGYDPRHSNLSSGLFSKLPFDERIDQLWFEVAKLHPVCFGYNKLMLSKFLVGANSGQPFLVVTPQVDANKYGYNLPASSVRDKAIQLILGASELVVFKPWFLYMVSIALFLLLLAFRKISVEIVVVYMSAGLYFFGLAIFGNAADARLLFYTNTMSVLGVVMIMSELLNLRSRKAAPLSAHA